MTDRRLIMAQITADMLNAAHKEAAERAKSEGMGFFWGVAHQMSVAFQYCQRYETLPPEFALTGTKGNRAIENVQLTTIDIKDKPTHQDSMEYHEFIMSVKSPEGKFEYANIISATAFPRHRHSTGCLRLHWLTSYRSSGPRPLQPGWPGQAAR